MDASKVHAIIAACLADPQIISALLANPEVTRQNFNKAGIDAEAFDWQSIQKFAGFVTKVRQNPVRNNLPLTFKALSICDLEIAVFTHYAPNFTHLTHNGYLPDELRTETFVGFLTNWLDATNPIHLLIKDIVNHEWTIEQLHRLNTKTPDEQPTISFMPTVKSVPTIQGVLKIQNMCYDMHQVIPMIQNNKLDMYEIKQKEFLLGYWCGGLGKQIKIVELQAIGAYILSAVNGERTIRDISDSLKQTFGKSTDEPTLLAFFKDYVEIGLLTFNQPSSTQKKFTYAFNFRR